ncbi:RadC family protein [Pedobacter sp. MW01-1-1]|uniref:RadC family protein n=1 Tax=Pedobacter sp. MW01-1-1 TaxID=3383027 RepID=UPI003FF01469
MENDHLKLGIKSWAEEDRPREKLLTHGRRYLTDAELIAILIGSGNRTETAVDLSKRILATYENNLAKLGRASIQELSRFRGIGEAKAISITAALELGLRRKEENGLEQVKVSSSSDAFRYLRSTFSDLNHEEFWILVLSRSGNIVSKQLISKGGQAGTIADPKVIFKVALQNNAASIILAHNHPSGNLKPSAADIKLTRQLVAGGDLLSLSVADHLIFADQQYYSFRDNDAM